MISIITKAECLHFTLFTYVIVVTFNIRYRYDFKLETV